MNNGKHNRMHELVYHHHCKYMYTVNSNMVERSIYMVNGYRIDSVIYMVCCMELGKLQVTVATAVAGPCNSMLSALLPLALGKKKLQILVGPCLIFVLALHTP